MDDPAIDPARHERALTGLAKLNRLSRAWAPLWSAIEPRARSLDRPMRLLDIATGGGDVLASLLRLAARRGLTIEAAAGDISETALRVARRRLEAAGVGERVELLRLDAVRDDLPCGFDGAMCSLFLHHLTGEQAAGLLRRMGGAAELVVASDLRRTRLNHLAARLASRALTRSEVVHVDALLSVRAAFTMEEMASVAHEAGLGEVRLRRVWPERMLLTGRGSS